MMLDISATELRQGFLQYLPIGALVGMVLLAEMLMIGGSWFVAPLAADFRSFPIPEINQITNTHAIGRILYTDYIYLFQGAGMVLLVAMVGAITLTLRDRPGVKKQNIIDQNARKVSDVITIVKVNKNEK